MAIGQNPVPPVNIPIFTLVGSKMGGEFTYQPKWDPMVLTTTATYASACILHDAKLKADDLLPRRPAVHAAERSVCLHTFG